VRRLLVFLLGFVAALLLLEGGLRLWGWGYMLWSHRASGEGEIGVYCLGESTTAFGREDSYPSQLERILNQASRPLGRGGGVGEAESGERRFSVTNGGVPGVDSSILVDRLPAELDRVRPAVLVAMMGGNDAVPRAAGEARTWGPDTVFARPSALRTWRLVQLARRERDRRMAEGMRIVAWSPKIRGGPCATSNDADCYPVSRAWDDVSEGDLDGAEHRLRDAGTAVASLELGVLLTQRERLVEAATAFETAAGDPRVAPEALVGLGRLYLGQRRLDEATAAFDRAIAAASTSADAWAGLGEARYFAQDCPKALRAMETADRLRPYDPRILEILGACQADQGLEDAAEATVLRAFSLYDGSYWFGSVQPRIRAVDVLERRGRTAEIQAWLEEAASVLPDEESPAAMLAAFYTRHGNAAEATRWQAEAERRRLAAYRPITRESYRRLREILASRGIRLVAMQYPRRPLPALVALFDDPTDVVFIDNEAPFEEALRTRSFAEVFTDDCYNDFGHGTALGNRILAENAAKAILGLLP